MKRLSIILSAACLLLLASCERFQTGPRAIKVRVSTASTKSPVTTTSLLENSDGFVLDAWVEGEYANWETGDEYLPNHYVRSNGSNNVVYSDVEGWKITSGETWVTKVQTSFWCYAPASPFGGLSFPTGEDLLGQTERAFHYSMAVMESDPNMSSYHRDADSCDDLIMSYAAKTYNGGDDGVNLLFLHALSQVNFAVSANDGTYDRTLKLVNVTISGIPTEGDCEFDGPEGEFSWDNLSGKGTYTQIYDAEFDSSNVDGWTNVKYKNGSTTFSLYVCDNSFFFIPHTLSGVKLMITFEDGGVQYPVEVSVPADTWEAGKYYTYKIKATTLKRNISASVSLLDWVHFDDKVFI